MWEDLGTAFLGLIILSKEKAEEFVNLLVEKGEMQREDAQSLVGRMIEKGKEEKVRLEGQWQQAKSRLEEAWHEKYVSREEFLRLEKKLDELAELVKEK